MGRIRCIKPEFTHSETLARVSRDARLLFVSLWTIVDDSGRTRGASRFLASVLFPYDKDAPKFLDGWLSELEAIGTVRRYVVDDNTYLDIPNWLKHQRIDRPSPSRFPPFDEASRTFDEASRTFHVGMEGNGKGREGDRKGTDMATASAFAAFWKAYPRKVGKDKAAAAWRKLNPDPATQAAIQSGLGWQVTQPAWVKDGGQFVPHAATWLNGRRWEDEPFNAIDPTHAAYERVLAGKGVLL